MTTTERDGMPAPCEAAGVQIIASEAESFEEGPEQIDGSASETGGSGVPELRTSRAAEGAPDVPVRDARKLVRAARHPAKSCTRIGR